MAKEKIPMEDFTQLIGASRATKYDVPMEKIAEAIENFCTFPTLEYLKLYKQIMLAFLLGNEDMHLKNLSIITFNKKIQLSPIYDFVNSTIANPSTEEELALSICGKKRGSLKLILLMVLPLKRYFYLSKRSKKNCTIFYCVCLNGKKWLNNHF